MGFARAAPILLLLGILLSLSPLTVRGSTLSLAAIPVKGQRAEFASIKVEDGQQQARRSVQYLLL